MPAYLSYSRLRTIKTWLDDVQRASRTPLPPLRTLPVESITRNTPSQAQQTGQLQISPRIPQNILDNINQQIYDTVGRHDIRLILAGLPNPTTRPLVSLPSLKLSVLNYNCKLTWNRITDST